MSTTELGILEQLLRLMKALPTNPNRMADAAELKAWVSKGGWKLLEPGIVKYLDSFATPPGRAFVTFRVKNVESVGAFKTEEFIASDTPSALKARIASAFNVDPIEITRVDVTDTGRRTSGFPDPRDNNLPIKDVDIYFSPAVGGK